MRTVLRWVRKWWPGLIPLGLLWIWAAWANTFAWEIDLAGRAATALKGNVLDHARVEATGRDLNFTADAFSEEAASRACYRRGCSRTRLVEDNTGLVPEAKPFVWAGERDVTHFTLSGNVPSPAIRGRLNDTLRGLPTARKLRTAWNMHGARSGSMPPCNY